MSIEQFNYENITFAAAKEFARIMNDAFKNDQILQAFVPKEARFDDASLPPIVEYEQLKARVDLFERLVESSARDAYVKVRSNPRERIFLLRNPSGPGYVGTARWMLPKYLDLPRIGFFMQIRNWFLKKWYAIRNFFTWFGLKNPVHSPGFMDEFKWAGRELGGEDTEERNEELHSLNLKQLKETSYPTDLTYYLHILAIRTDIHGKGFGRKLLTNSMNELGEFRGPPTIVGPAKVALFSAPTARGFYESLGFSIGAAAAHMLPTNELAMHTYFFKNMPTSR